MRQEPAGDRHDAGRPVPLGQGGGHPGHQRFVRIAGTGLACAFGVQALINMGVNVGLLPTKGLTLPLVSYGGSAALTVMIALGILMGVYRQRELEHI